MSDFMKFKEAVQKQLDYMSTGFLFVVDIDKEYLWNYYLDSYPEGTNLIYRERREYDCQCCRQFIRGLGNVVSIVDNKLVTIWDIDIDTYHQVVATKLDNLVKSKAVVDRYLNFEANVGTDRSHEMTDDGVKGWDHFFYRLDLKFVVTKRMLPTKLNDFRTTKQVFKRGLEELDLESAKYVLELIDEKLLHRGPEYKHFVEAFIEEKVKYDALPEEEKDNFCWLRSAELGESAPIRNTAIGRLLIDLSEGMDQEVAVAKYENMVSGGNFKRKSALITPRMTKKAGERVEELGLMSALERREAVAEDISINNVHYADNSVKPAMLDVFGELAASLPVKGGGTEGAHEVTMDHFMEDILPGASLVEVMVENKHQANLFTLVAPVHSDAGQLFKWNNNFSWNFFGEVADATKQLVKEAGGKVDGVLRFSIRWNDDGDNRRDFDAHAHCPGGQHIYYANKRPRNSGGELDVDITSPGDKVAVENITWAFKKDIKTGEYHFKVHNYSSNKSNAGFSAEIEYEGQIHEFVYDKCLRGGETVHVATSCFDKDKKMTLRNALPSTQSSKEVWGINTNSWHRVEMVMDSPNYWDGQTIGNQHKFFVLENCKNPEPSRGFYNEFLRSELRQDAKVFEVLSSKMKTSGSDSQLSGLGFCLTQRNEVFVRVTNSQKRIYKIKI